MIAPGRPSPIKTANEVTILLRAVLGEDRFPVDVAMVAADYSKRFADPITKVIGASLGEFEGMLRPGRKKPVWHIIYNNDTAYEGRERFTLAHEFGHYLLHRRPLAGQGGGPLNDEEAEALTFSCNPIDKHKWGRMGATIEEEADTFASYLLMPIDDYRRQVHGQDIGLPLLRYITDRYGVSLTAALRKWIEFTDRRAAMIVARDGFALWGRASNRACRSGIFIPSGLPIPDQSVATQGPAAQNGDTDRPVALPEGVWAFKRGSEPVRELTIFFQRLGKSLSLLLFDDKPAVEDVEDPRVADAVDQLPQWGTGPC